MASNQGISTIDFGSIPGSNEAFVTVTGQSIIQPNSKAESFIMASDTTADHTASDHQYVAIWLALTCGAPTAGNGFTIYGRSVEKLQGTFKVRWVWAD